MTTQQELKTRLSMEFRPIFIQVENESHLHHLGKGANTHFKVIIVCSQFENMNKVARHRLVYQLLAQMIQNRIHALALHTYTPKEWDNRNRHVPNSSNCLGVGQ